MEKSAIYDEWREQLLIYKGILFNNQIFESDFKADLKYDFDCAEYDILYKTYSLSKIAGSGSDFEKALRLVSHFSPKLAHKGDYDNHIHCNALSLLQYSLNRSEHGINCVCKSKILQECCLALGIFSRRVWLMPYSPYDTDNHVVNEIFDNFLNKWIMLDLTSGGYFVDENNTPLSVLEMRKKFALNLICNFKKQDNNLSEYFESRETEMLYYNKYFAKNLFYFVVEQENCFGDKGSRLIFLPKHFSDFTREKMNDVFRREIFSDNFFEFCKRSRCCDVQCLVSKPVSREVK